MAINNGRVRIAGHSYSLWIWGERPVAYATNVTHTSPQPLAQAVAIQPLNYIRPVEIVTGRAIGPGELSMTVTELYGYKPWEHLAGSFSGDLIHDLADVFHKMQREYTEHGGTEPNSRPIRFVRVIRPPGRGIHLERYFNIRITDVREDENVSIETLQNTFAVTIQYTHKKRVTVAGAEIQDPGTDPINIPDPRAY